MMATMFGFTRYPTDQTPGQAMLWWMLSPGVIWTSTGTAEGTSTANGVSNTTSHVRVAEVSVEARMLTVPTDPRVAVVPADPRTT